MKLRAAKSIHGEDLSKILIQNWIREKASFIKAIYKSEDLVLLTIMGGGLFLTVDFCRSLIGDSEDESPFKSITVESVKCSSYLAAPEGGGEMVAGLDFQIHHTLTANNIEGRVVVVIDDIIDTGRTMHAVIDLAASLGAKCVTPLALLYKPSKRLTHYTFEEDEILKGVPVEGYVVGYGLDSNGRYRERNRIYWLG